MSDIVIREQEHIGRWALIDAETGSACEFTSANPEGRFHSSFRWIPAPPRAGIGWIETRDESGAGTGKLVPPSIDSIRAQLLTEVSDMRRRVEGGGIVLPSGAVILTGLDDQNRVSAALTSMERFNISAIDFKAASGWVKLTVAELSGIGAAIAAHVQNCFSAERAHHEAIAAQTDLDALAGYDTSHGWPGNEAREGTQNGEESA